MSWIGLTIVGAIGAVVAALTIYSAVIRKGSGTFLCDDCKFNNPEDCLKPERPKAVICTAYRKITG